MFESKLRVAELFAPAPLGHAVLESVLVHSVTVCAWFPVFVQVKEVPAVTFLVVGL